MVNITRTYSDRLRAWILPAALVTTGMYSWACVDDPDLSGSDTSGADGSGSDIPAQEGSSGSDPTTTTSAPATAGSTDVTRADVIASIASRVILPATELFSESTAQLQTAVDAYATAVDADPVAAGVELSAAQDAWQANMLSWQRLEVMQVGPAAPSSAAPGGDNLRDEVYSWPTVDTCAVDRRIVSREYEDENFFILELVSNYGIDALEYLLFVHDQNHTCSTQIQLDGPWTGLGFEEIERRRGAYAARVAAELVRQAEELRNRWSPEGDDFTAALSNPGPDSPFESETVALDDIFRAMFYIDKQTKDAKLGRTLGLLTGCAEVPCPELLEVPFGQVSAAAIAENLEALKLMVAGGPDPATDAGFDDLLTAAGQAQVALDLNDAIDNAIAAANAFETPLQQVVATELNRVEDLHSSVRAVTDILKGPFVMTLMLTIPAEGAGDAD